MELLFLIFILGLFVGSFLNVLIDRLPKGEQIFKGRSYCEYCKEPIKWYDLIPVVSFAVLKSRCRYCNASLSYYYPLVEIVTGLMFVITASFFFSNFQANLNSQLEQTLTLLYYLFMTSVLLVIFFVDLKYGIIPDKIILGAFVIVFLFTFTSHQSLITNHLLSAIGAFLFFLLIFLVTRGRGMGFGDVKFAFFMGLVLGFAKIIVALYVAFLTGAIVSLILILIGKKKFHGSTVPFGPFLVTGTFTALFWGKEIMQIVFPFYERL